MLSYSSLAAKPHAADRLCRAIPHHGRNSLSRQPLTALLARSAQICVLHSLNFHHFSYPQQNSSNQLDWCIVFAVDPAESLSLTDSLAAIGCALTIKGSLSGSDSLLWYKT